MKGDRSTLKIHIVKKGDTLWELSKSYGVDFEALKAANSHIASPDMIMPGMKIRIPTNAKTVKKEAAVKEIKKEQQVQTPYKDISPKPIPVIKEDDEKPTMEIKPEIPMPQMPQIPQMTMPQVMQAPTMEQEQTTYMMFNFPESSESVESAKMPKEQPILEPAYQQPMYQPHMVPCYPVHPCCCGGHHVFPMHPMHMAPPMPHPTQLMPMQDMDNGDCGCGGGTGLQTPPMGQIPQYDQNQGFMPQFDPNMYTQGQGTMPQIGFQNQGNMPQMGSNMTFPSMAGLNENGFPTPPGFGELRTNNEEESSD